MKRISVIFTLILVPELLLPQVKWEIHSSRNGELEPPNTGKEQTSCAVADFNNDGLNDFCISERTAAPAMVWYQRTPAGWLRNVVEDSVCFIEAGTVAFDVDNDGDNDIIAGGEAKTNEVWWWENPYPDFSKSSWPRHTIRKNGGNKIHDQLIGDFDGDLHPDLVFWAQGDRNLYFTRIPDNPKESGNWKLIPVYTYFSDSQMEQHGTYPSFKGINEHEGLAKADIDGDGIQDIIGGGLWFRYTGDDKFSFNTIDGGYTFSRSAAGQLINGGRPEVILVVGDGWAPMYMYEFQNGTWIRKEIIPNVSNGHSLAIMDFNNDGSQDIWTAEMTLFDNNKAINQLLLGDGRGNFTPQVISTGLDVHDSEIADLDGDGDLDVLGKPYNGGSPAIDIYLQNGTGEIVSLRNGSFPMQYGLQLYSMRFEFQKDVPGTIAAIAAMGIREIELSGYYGLRAEEFRELIRKYKLKCTSMIFDYGLFETDPSQIIKEARLFDAKYVGIGWIPHEKYFGKEVAEKAVADFNRFGAEMKKAGLRFFYHPHGYEFNTPEGNMMDLILERTDPSFVTFQLDVFWMNHGGASPFKYLEKYPGRFELMHLKEMRPDVIGNNSGGAPDASSVALGRGVTDWPALLRLAQKSGVKKYYIEDESKEAVTQVFSTISFLNSLR